LPMHARVALRAGVAADDDAFGIDNDGLTKPEFLDRRCHGSDDGVVMAGIARAGPDVGKLPQFDFHRSAPQARENVLVAPRYGERPRQSRAADRLPENRLSLIHMHEFIIADQTELPTLFLLRSP